jgi:hypothetical protein
MAAKRTPQSKAERRAARFAAEMAAGRRVLRTIPRPAPEPLDGPTQEYVLGVIAQIEGGVVRSWEQVLVRVLADLDREALFRPQIQRDGVRLGEVMRLLNEVHSGQSRLGLPPQRILVAVTDALRIFTRDAGRRLAIVQRGKAVFVARPPQQVGARRRQV